MPVIINDQRLVPSPIVSFAKQISLADNGEFIGSDYVFSLQGQILATQGNPIVNSSGNISEFSSDSWTSTYDPADDPLHGIGETDRLLAIITKQEQIRALLSPPTGVKVEIVGWNNDIGIKFVGNVSNLSVQGDGRWVNPCTYSFDVTTSNFIESAGTGIFSNNSSEDSPTYFISSIGETWALQESDQYIIGTGLFNQISKSYSVVHDVSAKGKPVYNESGTYLDGLQPWQQASGYVRGVIGLGTNPPGLINPTGLGFYLSNRKLTENIDRYAGTYGISEQYTYFNSGILPENYFASEDVSLSVDQGEDALTSVSINGTITGFDTIDPTSGSRSGVNKYQNALDYFNRIESGLYNRALLNAGLSWLHPKPLSKTVGRNPVAGQVSYSLNFNNRPPNIINGSISENIDISDQYPSQIIAIVPVIGGNQPALQYVNSNSEYRRTLNINVNMAPIGQNWSSTGVNNSGVWIDYSISGIRNWLIGQKPSVTNTVAFSSIYESCNPANQSDVIPSLVFYQEPSEQWNPRAGGYSYSVSWVYTKIS